MSHFQAPLPDPVVFARLSERSKVISLVDTLPVYTWRMDRDWRMTEVSPAFEWVIGLPPKELLGVRVMDPDWGRAETESGLAHYFTTLRAQRSFANFCYERILVDGTRAVLMDSAVPVLAADGSFDGYHGITFQLTRAIEQAGETASLVYSLHSRADKLEKQLSDRNKELEETNRLLTEIVEAMGEGLLVTSGVDGTIAESRVEFVNRAYLDQFGLSPDDVRPGSLQVDLLAALVGRGELTRDGTEMQTMVDDLATKGTAMIRLQQSKRTLYCKAAHRPSGGRVYVHTDVTELEERSTALRQALDRADAANAAKSNFLAAMSHEFRTPLNGIVGVTELLAETALDGEQQELVETIQSSAAALTSLISDILDFSKIEAGHDNLIDEPLALAALAREVVALLRPMAQAKGLTLNLEIAPEVPLIVMGDKLRLRQVLLNLLGNAVKFTDRGHVVLRVSGDQPVKIAVDDTGIGIPQEDLAHIHEPFRQVQSGLHRRFEGTGLGLAISRKLIEMMGGSMEIRSTLGQGSSFIVTLPMAASLGVPIDESAPLAAKIRLDGVRILVAEDNQTNQLVLKKMLERAGAEVAIVASGTAAVEAVRRARFDMILMDAAMPGMNGFDACRVIRSHEAASGAMRCPVIAVTGNAFDKDRAAAKAAGMDDFLAKPVRRDDVLACVAQHLRDTSLAGQPVPQS